VEQRFYSVTTDDKRAAVVKVLADRGIKQAIVFVNSKLGCARLARSLERDGLKTNALHGDKSQDERLKALDAFKKGETDVLVCTDVAARGLDIADLPAVINFDVPFNAEDYVHRIGRTGRAGATGKALSLADEEYVFSLEEIEKYIGQKIPVEWADDAMYVREIRRTAEERQRAAAQQPAPQTAQRRRFPKRAGQR
jgi:superfamily II DNA/RNA helicase